jgi:adenosylcobinamide-phosphate synthase
VIRLEYQILAAVALDLALGDPRWLPHPVRAIAWLARRLEALTRRLFGPGPRGLKLAGIITVVLTCAVVGLAAWGLILAASLLHPLAGDMVGIIIMYTTLAGRDLVRHSLAVCRPLERGDLPAARRSVAMIVGRDTENLDEAGVTRAAVESVAESTVDGVTAPLFFALLAGPVGAIVYRAVNTLDSTFGYKDERYLHFGWAAARLDDVANYIPARLTAPLVALAAALLGLRPWQSLRILRRDGRKHESPNSGWPEAAMAGALGVQLGGTNLYQGEPLEKPAIGDPLVPLTARHIRLANALMAASAGLFLIFGLAARVGAVRAWDGWRGGP